MFSRFVNLRSLHFQFYLLYEWTGPRDRKIKNLFNLDHVVLTLCGFLMLRNTNTAGEKTCIKKKQVLPTAEVHYIHTNRALSTKQM